MFPGILVARLKSSRCLQSKRAQLLYAKPRCNLMNLQQFLACIPNTICGILSSQHILERGQVFPFNWPSSHAKSKASKDLFSSVVISMLSCLLIYGLPIILVAGHISSSFMALSLNNLLPRRIVFPRERQDITL